MIKLLNFLHLRNFLHNVTKIGILSFLIIQSSCLSYDYYRFDDNRKMVVGDSETAKVNRTNILYENEDLQIIAKIEETRLPPFSVSVDFKPYEDSVLIESFEVSITDNGRVPKVKSLVNFSQDSVIYFYGFNTLPKSLRLNPNKTFYFGFGNAPKSKEIGLDVFLQYRIKDKMITDTVHARGLKRRNGGKHLVPLH
jgi:hypothetical protein